MPPPWAERAPDDREREVLEAAYNALVEHKQWASNGYLESVLRRDADLNLEHVLATMPMGLLWPDPAFGGAFAPSSQTAVTVFGLTFVSAAARDLDVFVRALRWAADQRDAYVPPVGEGDSALLRPAAALTEALEQDGVSVEPADLQRVFLLCAHEPYVPSLHASGDVATWQINVPRDVLVYRGVDSLDDFFTRRPEMPRMERRPAIDDAARMVDDHPLEWPLTGEVGNERDGGRPSPDQPLTDPKTDRFGYAPLAARLARSIGAESPAESIVIGVYGDWGLGKSTLLNFVAHYLQSEKTNAAPIVIRFNPWRFTSSTDLANRFFEEILTELSRRHQLTKAARKIARYASRLQEAPVPKPWVVDWLFQLTRWIGGGSTDLESAKKDVERALKSQPRRIVVLLDDLDRLTADDLREVFRMVKVVADFPNVTYVLALSRDAAVHALQGSVDDASEYLEKIVQMPIELPRPDALDVFPRDVVDVRLRL